MLIRAITIAPHQLREKPYKPFSQLHISAILCEISLYYKMVKLRIFVHPPKKYISEIRRLAGITSIPCLVTIPEW